MLGLLTDEHISHVVADQIRHKRPDIRIESVLRWRGGVLRQNADDLVLAAAHEERLTLVTYDQKTIPPILVEVAMNGGHHSGVIFVDRNAINTSNIGGLVQALIAFHDLYHGQEWTDTVMFLTPAKP